MANEYRTGRSKVVEALVNKFKGIDGSYTYTLEPFFFKYFIVSKILEFLISAQFSLKAAPVIKIFI